MVARTQIGRAIGQDMPYLEDARRGGLIIDSIGLQKATEVDDD